MTVLIRSPLRLGAAGFVAILLGTAAVPRLANASLLFHFTFDSSINATNFGSAANVSALEADMIAVGTTFSGLFSNIVTLNLKITADTAPGALAASGSTYDQSAIYSYAAVRAAMLANPSFPSASILPATEPASSLGHGYIVPSAESKALGLTVAHPPGSDGTMYIGTNIGGGSNWDFSGVSTPAASDYSFVDAAYHEVSELMGRTTQLTNPGWPWNGPMDLLRCSAGAVNMSPAATGVYFSMDACVTHAKGYNAPNANGADIQDWASSSIPDPFDAYGTPGAFAAISAVDIQVMNALGWTSAAAETAVPEPATMALLLPGLLAVIRMKGHRRGQ